MIRVGAVSHGWSGTSLPDVFEQLAAMGGECIEINGNAEKHHGLPLTARTAPQVRGWAKAAGLVIGSLSGYNDFAQETAEAVDLQLAGLLETCRAAAELEAPIVRAFVGEPKAGLDLGSVRPRVIEAFQRAADVCETLGVRLAIENHGRLVNDGRLLSALVEDIGASNVALTLDTGNFAWAGHDPAETATDIEAALRHTINVHIKDGVWQEGAFRFVPAGDGALDLRGLMTQLAGGGYRGMVYSEYEGDGEFLEGTRRSIKLLRALCGAS